MASGGSSGRPSALSHSFDFGSNDVLCAYDDIGNQDHSNGKRMDPSGKEYRDNRTGRSLMDVYGQREEFDNRDVLTSVEKCMKKHADNLLRVLEGITGRLSQLEQHCYSLERSLGDLRSDMGRDQSESDQKLKSLDKHLQEIHRSVQILRDKQELAETQRELAKLQLASKEPSDGGAATTAPAAPPEPSGQPLALALPPPPPRAPEPPAPVPQPAAAPPASNYAQVAGGGTTFYAPYSQWQAPPTHFSQPPPPHQPGQTQSTPPPYPPGQAPNAPPPYQPGQTHSAPLPFQPGQTQSVPPYQQGQTQSMPPPYQPGQTQSTPPPYQRGQPQSVPPPHELYGGGGPLQAPPYSGMSKGGGYGGGYYGGGGYATAAPAMGRGHPYAELIDKAINMGYPRDLVVGAVRHMEESSQPVDFNSLLDLLNSRPGPPPSQRWSS
ncbi:formin-like protein (DUF1421) [Wolffia australiana]